MTAARALRKRCADIWDHLHKNNLWQRMLRYSVAVTADVILSIIPAVRRVYGPSTFLGPLVIVFGHPGQRLGMMVEALSMIFFGTLLGIAWALLGLYLSSLVHDTNAPAAYTVRAIFLALAAIWHGYYRSASPRLFNFILFMLIACIVILTGTETSVSPSTATNLLWPLFSATAIIIICNVAILPEFAGGYLGATTIEALSLTSNTLRDATAWFIAPLGQQDGEGSGPTAPPGRVGATQPNLTATGQSAPDSTTGGGAGGSDPIAQHSKALASLTDRKTKVRAKLKSCKSALDECIYELTYSVLPPRCLKPISKVGMTSLVHNTIALVGACESKYALIGKEGRSQPPGEDVPPSTAAPSEDGGQGERVDDSDTGSDSSGDRYAERVKQVKARREIEKGDAELLESILGRLRAPVQDLQAQLDDAVNLMITCLSFCLDVARLPSGAITPRGIRLEEIDLRIDAFSHAISAFDKASASALERAARLDPANPAGLQFDIMPRTETFLVSSFLLGLRQAADNTLEMLRQARVLVEKRHARHDRKRIYFPMKMDWKKWLMTGGERGPNVLPKEAGKEARAEQGAEAGEAGGDTADNESSTEESLPGPANGPNPNPELRRRHDPITSEKHCKDGLPDYAAKSRGNWILALRGLAADIGDGLRNSEDLPYALKLAVAVFLCSFPAFSTVMNGWYAAARGVWAPLQLVLVFEVAIGASFWVFLVRAAGVFYGCLCGYLSYEIGRGNLVALVVILQFGIIPSAYVQISTPYIKAGMISVVSMTVIAFATVDHTGTAWENYLKRFAAFMVGGTLALLVEVAVYPVKARVRLVESLSACIHHISTMEASLAAGVEGPVHVNTRDARLMAQYPRSRAKAEAALGAAETFLPFCLTEPRLKGSFRTLEPIYREIVYVLHQIIDRMDNIVRLRRAYGSSVLEELNPQVYMHRRNVAASIILTLFAVGEALTVRLPLPQFLPSSRLAQLRLVSRVRDVLRHDKAAQDSLADSILRRSSAAAAAAGRGPARHGLVAPAALDEATIRSVTRQRFLSWNAAAAGQMEIIEYLEELADLAKLLVGVNAFRSGMLERPSYQQYVRRIRARQMSFAASSTAGGAGGSGTLARTATRATFTGGDEGAGAGGDALERVRTGRSSLLRRRRKTTTGALGPEAGELGTFRERWRGTRRASHAAAGGSAVDDGDDDGPEGIPASLESVGLRMRQERWIARSMSVSEDRGEGARRGRRTVAAGPETGP